MNHLIDTLERMSQALQACEQGLLPESALIQQWRQDARVLPLPDRFGEVLAGLLDRMEAAALFRGESCSFSQQDLFDSLKFWASKAKAQIQPTVS